MIDVPTDEPGAKKRPTRLGRIVGPVVALVGLGFAVHVLLPQVADLEQGLRALRTGRWPFLALAVIGSTVTYVSGAWMVRASVDVPPPWGRATLIQVAAGAAATITPAGLGWLAVNQSYLQKEGVGDATAKAATGLNLLLTVVSHVGLLLVLLPFLPALNLPIVTPLESRVFVDVVVVVTVAAGLLVWIPRVRRKTISVLKPILEAVPGVVRDPKRSALMVVAAVATNVAYGFALFGAVAAFGSAPPPLGVLVVYLVAATIAAIAPTPGGLGAMEAALVAGLTRLAIPGGQAVAATLAFRLATFWLPLAVGFIVLQRARRRGWI